MLYKLVLTFEYVDEVKRLIVQMKRPRNSILKEKQSLSELQCNNYIRAGVFGYCNFYQYTYIAKFLILLFVFTKVNLSEIPLVDYFFPWPRIVDKTNK